MSFPEIGRSMGNKNHSTVILACAKLNRILDQDEEVRWNTPAGEKKRRLRLILDELEEQLGLQRPRPVAPTLPAAKTTPPPAMIRPQALEYVSS